MSSCQLIHLGSVSRKTTGTPGFYLELIDNRCVMNRTPLCCECE